jgi:putative transposase
MTVLHGLQHANQISHFDLLNHSWPKRASIPASRKNPDQVGFVINPRRWVVKRFFAWIGRNRRLAKDFEATIDSAHAFLYAAFMLLARWIARAS